MPGSDILGMSDDSFLESAPPVVDKEADAALAASAPPPAQQEEQEEQQPGDETGGNAGEGEGETDVPAGQGKGEGGEAGEQDEKPPVDNSGEKQPPAITPAPKPGSEQPVDKSGAPATSPASSPVPGSDAKGKEGEQGKPDAAGTPAAPAPSAGTEGGQAPAKPLTAEQYKAGYELLMAPFKANGKMFQPQSPEEALKLMQMGANFTRKMQDIAPHRKVLIMLENNGLLDEGKLSFLIDLERKDPEAIKKLVKDSGLNPLEIDTEQPSAYRAGNHSVGDEEVGFRTVLEDMQSTPEGKQTLSVINSTWDQASKDMLWKEPQVMTAIDQQRASGVYATITAEMDRLTTLGSIPAGMPFLKAYQAAAESLVRARKIGVDPQGSNGGGSGTPAATPAAPAAPLGTRVATPKPAVSNGAAARAAGTSRSAPNRVEKFVNPLNMSDEDFMKMAVPRV